MYVNAAVSQERLNATEPDTGDSSSSIMNISLTNNELGDLNSGAQCCHRGPVCARLVRVRLGSAFTYLLCEDPWKFC